MAIDIPLRCRCGKLRGVAREVSGDGGNRVVCHCDDCQTWIHHLDGRAEWLDANGGTEVFQLSPARIELSEGVDQLRCKQLQAGSLMRWYAACCDTPIANTLGNAQLPFAGIVHACMDHEGVGRSRDEALGPVRAHVFGRFATGDRASLEAHDRAPLSLFLRILIQVLSWRLRGDHRRSPFFDAETLQPICAPEVLAPDELTAAQSARRRRA